jgi:spore germination cell wall hydrolase CwlJ-like protein
MVTEIVDASTSYYSKRVELLQLQHKAKMEKNDEKAEQQRQQHKAKMKKTDEKTEQQREQHQIKMQILQLKLHKEQWGIQPIQYSQN